MLWSTSISLFFAQHKKKTNKKKLHKHKAISASKEFSLLCVPKKVDFRARILQNSSSGMIILYNSQNDKKQSGKSRQPPPVSTAAQTFAVQLEGQHKGHLVRKKIKLCFPHTLFTLYLQQRVRFSSGREKKQEQKQTRVLLTDLVPNAPRSPTQMAHRSHKQYSAK